MIPICHNHFALAPVVRIDLKTTELSAIMSMLYKSAVQPALPGSLGGCRHLRRSRYNGETGCLAVLERR